MILAILLASATATTLKGRRAKSAISHQSQRRGEVTAGFKSFGIRDERFDRSRRDRSNARNCDQPPHVLVTLHLADDTSFELIDLARQWPDLLGDFSQSQTGGFWQANVLIGTHDLDQLR